MRFKLTEYMTIKRSRLFDPRYYLLKYGDIRRADVDPLVHFIHTGWKEGRNPSAIFDTKKYLAKHPALVDKNINPLIHFINQEKQKVRQTLEIRKLSASM